MKNHALGLVFILYTFIAPVNADSHRPQEFLKSISGSSDEGKQIYQHFCINCHARKPIISIGAPRYRMKQDWMPRLKQDICLLFKHTDEGLNAMPARGGCFECTDHQLLLATVTMLPKRVQKDVLAKLLDYKKSTK